MTAQQGNRRNDQRSRSAFEEAKQYIFRRGEQPSPGVQIRRTDPNLRAELRGRPRNLRY